MNSRRMKGFDGHTEVERAFVADEDTALPDLRIEPVASTESGVAVEMTATYHDTVDLRLARSGITVRRRTGGRDEGWHLKVRAPDDPGSRLELHRAVGRTARMPVALRRLLQGATRDAPLAPVAEVATQRREHRLLDGAGTALAVVADDRVAARLLPEDTDQPPVRWREVEVELGAGDTELLGRLAAVLHDAGLPDSPEQSKLRRALAQRLPAAGPDPLQDTAAAVLGAHLQRLAVTLVVRDLLVRAAQDDGVHQLRIAARRLRSVLAAYRPLLDDRAARRLERELRWLGRALAAARDLEVTSEQLVSLLDDETAHATTTRAVARRVHRAVVDERPAVDAAARETLASNRYAWLLEAADRLVEDPPWTEEADRPARRTMRRRVRKAHRRTISAMASAEPLEGTQRDLALHSARKAAKRTRYALEVAEPVLGKPARRLRKRTRRLQQTLGGHQDTVLLRGTLRGLAEDSADAEVAFSCGRLHALLQHRATRLDQRAQANWHRVTTPKAAGWLS